MKRPWTPGPWKDKLHRWGWQRQEDYDLAKYAPEMAELLIELDEIAAVGITSEIYKIFHKIPALLRSIGYEPTVDTDPAD